MRHRRARTKLGRTSAHRHAMYSNMLAALVEHGRIRTTQRKAHELRGIAERAVARATALGDLLTRDRASFSAEERAQYVHAIRQVRRTVKERGVALRLFEDIAPRFVGRPGGFTRICKTGFRRGDGAAMALIEFVDAELVGGSSAQADDDAKKGGIVARLKRKKSE